MTTLFALTYAALLLAAVFATVAVGMAAMHSAFFALERLGASMRKPLMRDAAIPSS